LPEDLDLAFGILTVASFASSFILFALIVACSTVYVWTDALARRKSWMQALVWALASAMVAPFGMFMYLAVHSREGKTGVTPPLLSTRGLIGLAIVFMALFFVVNPSIALPVTNEGASMEPTLEDGDRLIGDRISARWDRINRGDIVLLRDLDGDLLVKRIIGLPGDTIAVNRGRTLINNQPLTERYIFMPPRYYLPPLRVPDDTYYVLGDNRNISVDSHFFGPVPAGSILAKVRYRFWPLNRVSIID